MVRPIAIYYFSIMNLVIKSLRYQIANGFVETFSFRLRLYDDLSYTFFFFFLLTFLTMRFESLVHFSCSFKFLNSILLRFCHWFCVSVFNMFAIHSLCSIFCRILYVYVCVCFTFLVTFSRNAFSINRVFRFHLTLMAISSFC